MIRLFWNALKITPVLFAASLFAANGASAQSVSANKEAVNKTLQQINNYQQLEQSGSLSQVTNVNQLRDVSPTDWAYEALRSLVDRYGCISGFPNQTYRGNQPLSRYEFAAGLNSCLNQIERLIASQNTVTQEDLDTVNRLAQEFEAELATLGGRVDEIESRTAVLEDSQFSTTTKLKGEAIFAIADVFGDEIGEIDDVSGNNETTFSSRARLNFDTSFFGEDRLRTRLQGGNFTRLDADITGTDSTRLGFDTDGGFDIEITDLNYRFPVGERITAHVGPVGLDLDDVFSVSSEMLESSSSGALSRFSRRNPLLFRGPEGAGAGVNFEVIPDKLTVSGLYLSDSDDASNPTGVGVDDDGDPTRGGLFNSSFSAGAQAVFSPIEALEVSATYVRSFQANGGDFAEGTVSGAAEEPFGDADTTANRIGLGASFELGERIILAGFGGYADATGLVEGDDNNLSGDVWTWGANISFLDLVKEGSQLSVAGGMLPRFTTDEDGLEEDEDTSYLVEALYRFPLNDNISITPGAFVVFNPNHDEDNDTAVVGVVRTTFKF